MALPPEQYARELRFRLVLHGPVDVVEVANSLGIEVHEDELDQCDGVLLRLGGRALILVSRKRFTVAHERSHFCIPSHNSREFRCTEAEISDYRSVRVREREADEFASELLLRSRLARYALPRAAQAGSSLTAMPAATRSATSRRCSKGRWGIGCDRVVSSSLGLHYCGQCV